MRIIIDLTDTEAAALLNDLVDINEWFQSLKTAKVHACRQRLIQEGRGVLASDPLVTNMPARDDALITAYITRPDYKTRAQRQAEADAELIESLRQRA